MYAYAVDKIILLGIHPKQTHVFVHEHSKYCPKSPQARISPNIYLKQNGQRPYKIYSHTVYIIKIIKFGPSVAGLMPQISP